MAGAFVNLCKDCRFWGANSEWNLAVFPERAKWRDCDHPNRKAVGTGHPDCGSDLSTEPDFGCVQFEGLIDPKSLAHPAWPYTGTPWEWRIRSLTVGNLPSATVEALKEARMDPRHEALNALMQER